MKSFHVRSRNSAHKCRAAFGSLYKWAAKRMLVDSNIIIGMGYNHQSRPRGRTLTNDEIGKMWSVINGHQFEASPSMRLVLKLTNSLANGTVKLRGRGVQSCTLAHPSSRRTGTSLRRE